MKVKVSPRIFIVAFVFACALTITSPALMAQAADCTDYSCIQLFGAVNGANSLPGVSITNPDAFNSTTLNMSCPATPVAYLSGPYTDPGTGRPPTPATLTAGGNLLVDNSLIVTVTPTGGPAQSPINVCPLTNYTEGSSGLYHEDCFTSSYQGIAGTVIGNDPDTFPATGATVETNGGVPPINIASPFTPTSYDTGNSPPSPPPPPAGVVPGSQSVTIALTDEGGSYTSSTIFLTTNCTVSVSGGTVSGNQITTGSSGTGLTQTFNFNTQTDQQVGFVYDLSVANTTPTNVLTNSGAIPQVADQPVDPTAFQPSFVAGTSFATSSCLIHTGETLSNGSPACKLYTLECLNPSNGSLSGANCPVSAFNDEVMHDVFDGPQFSLQNITTPFGTFREGIGLLMASEPWPMTSGAPSSQPGPCTFDSTTGLEDIPCPQNLLISFSGPGGFDGKGLTTNPNSTFISLYGVPQDFTTVLVAGEWPDHWVNNSSPKAYFLSQAPNFSKGAYVLNGRKLTALPGASNFIPAPIQSLTYGVSPAGSTPLPIDEPIQGDVTVPSSANCAAAPFTAKTVPNFAPPAQTLSYNGAPLADGQYMLHYFAEDCAGTQELQFALNGGSWATNFFTVPVNVDTIAPQVAGLALSPSAASYKRNSVVYATYSCSDANSSSPPNTGSGVVLCGINIYAPETTYSTPTLKTRLNTSTTGTKSVTIYAADGAGNTSSATIHYTVTK